MPDAPFDPAKDRVNRAKHGLSLARFVEMTHRMAFYSPRRDEDRWAVLGLIDGVVHLGIVTLRDGEFRPISLRRASRRERKVYTDATHT